MRNLFSFFLILSLAFLCWQCGGESTATADNQQTAEAKVSNTTPAVSTNGTVIKGQIKNANDLTLFMEQYSFMDNVHDIQGRQTVGADGSFSIALDKPLEPGVYRLRVGRQKVYIPLSGGEQEINITADLETFDLDHIQVAGSSNFSKSAKVLSDLEKGNLTEEGAASAIESLDNPILGAMVATNVYGANPQYLNVHQQLNEQIGKVMPNSPLYRKHGAMVRQLIAAANDPIQIGKIPPNIQLTDPEGKTYSLDQLKGKVVLLDFWASWCGPCRRENPNVVRVYDKYNKEGFEVFSVSLDKQNGKQRWVNAIEKDNLKWPYHVSDLQGWNSAPAKEYKVSSIPRTFLLDRDGKIAEMNPRGPALEKAVKKLLGKG